MSDLVACILTKQQQENYYNGWCYTILTLCTDHLLVYEIQTCKIVIVLVINLLHALKVKGLSLATIIEHLTDLLSILLTIGRNGGQLYIR